MREEISKLRPRAGNREREKNGGSASDAPGASMERLV